MELKIKEVLKENKTTVVALAEAVGITQPNMSNIVNGKSTPSLETLEKIANALNVPITSLFKEEANEELTALIQHKGDFYKASTIAELEKIVAEIKEK